METRPTSSAIFAKFLPFASSDDEKTLQPEPLLEGQGWHLTAKPGGRNCFGDGASHSNCTKARPPKQTSKQLPIQETPNAGLRHSMFLHKHGEEEQLEDCAQDSGLRYILLSNLSTVQSWTCQLHTHTFPASIPRPAPGPTRRCTRLAF